MYKNQVEIPPLLMQDDTLAVSECGYKTIRMNNFLNTQTNIMSLQFGRDKCVKLLLAKQKIMMCVLSAKLMHGRME